MKKLLTGALVFALGITSASSADWETIIQDINVGLSFVDLRNRDAIEKGGLDEEMAFKHYRFMSRRWLLSAGYAFHDEATFYLSMGSSSIRTHSSEGETWEFDSAFSFGIALEDTLYTIPEHSILIRGKIGLLTLSSSKGNLIRLSRFGPDRGSMSIDWTEIELAIDAARQLNSADIYFGMRYKSLSVDQKRVFEGVKYKSSFDQDAHIGFYAGLTIRTSQNSSLFGQLNFRDETSFQTGVRYDF